MKGDRGSEQQPPPLRQQQRPAVPSHGRLFGADVGRTGSSCSDRYDDDNVVAASPIASYLGEMDALFPFSRASSESLPCAGVTAC